MKFSEIQEACWSGYQQQGMKKKGDRMVPNCVPVDESTGDPFIDNAARELLAMVLMFGVPFVAGVYMDLRNKLRKYQGKEIIDALERKGVTMNRQTYEKVKPVLDRFDQAIRDDDGTEARALAKQIEQMIIMGKLSAPEPRPADTALAAKEKELAEDLKKWFREKWVRFGPDGRIRGDCARGSESEGKPKCLPQSKAHALGKKGRASAAAKKRREDPNPERRGPARNVATKVRETTAMQDPNFAAGMAAKKAGGGATDIMLAQPDIAKNQQYLDKIAAAYGLPAGLSAEQIKAKYQAASQQRAIDDIARKQGLPAGMTKDQLMQAWRKKVQGQTQTVAEGAQDDSERHHGWRAELVDEITPTTFEVQLTNRRSRETANFVVRPVDMIRPGLAGKFSIDSMDLKDLQTGATRSIQSDSDEPWVYILDAVSALFWDTPALQARLQAQIKAHQDQGLSMLPGLKQRRSAGQGMPVKDFVKGQQAGKDAVTRAQGKKGMAEVKEDVNPKFAGLIKNIQARMKKDDYQRPEIIKRVAQMVQQADPTVQDAMATARELVQQYGQGPVVKQTNVWDLKAQARSGNLAAQLPKTSAGTPSYAQQHATFEEQSTNDDDWYDDADEFGMPGSEFFPDDDRLRDGDYVRDRQDGESGEIFRMSGDPSERRVRILDRDGKGWYISPERLVAVNRNDPDIMKYFGKHRHRDMDESEVADALQNYLQVTGENDVEAVKSAIQKIARDASLKPTAKARLLGQVGMMIKTHKLPVGREYYQYMQQFMEQDLDEKQDACYRKVKSRYKVWPSAYASGALVQCRKKGAANWGNKTKKE